MSEQLGHADPAMMLRAYAHLLPRQEEDIEPPTSAHQGEPQTALYGPSPLRWLAGRNRERRNHRRGRKLPGRGGRIRTDDLRLPKPSGAFENPFSFSNFRVLRILYWPSLAHVGWNPPYKSPRLVHPILL